MKLLTFTTLFPNQVQPAHGVFVENRLRQLLAGSGFEARVVAPCPWFPFRHRAFGDYAIFAQVPRHEVRHGITIQHPRFPVLPKFGMNLGPFAMYAAVRPTIARLLYSDYDFDLIDAHYFFPDGVAAALLGASFKRPVSITVRGSDANVIGAYKLPRRMMLWAARRAACLIAVSHGLKSRLIELGIPAERITVLRNGVDLDLFKPSGRELTREKLALSGPVLISVGNLIPTKGHQLAIAALPAIPAAQLLIVGKGPEAEHLRRQAASLGVAERVHLLGPIEHEQLPGLYASADVLILASRSEGWPNVLLEAMACGTPVVSTDVSGASELVTQPAAGILLRERTSKCLAEAVRNLLSNPPNRHDTRAYAERFSWDSTTRGQIDLFTSAVSGEANRMIA